MISKEEELKSELDPDQLVKNFLPLIFLLLFHVFPQSLSMSRLWALWPSNGYIQLHPDSATLSEFSSRLLAVAPAHSSQLPSLEPLKSPQHLLPLLPFSSSLLSWPLF